MADVKFSALTSAGTLDGTELICVSQGVSPVSKKLALSQLGTPVLGYDGTNTMFDLSAAASTRIRLKSNQAVATLDGFLQSGNSTPVFIGSNVYWDGTNYRYQATGAASLTAQFSSGVWVVYTFPSGTAGAIATTTGALVFSNAGGLSIGTVNDAGAGNLLATGLLTCAGFDLSATAGTKLRIKSNQTTATFDAFLQSTSQAPLVLASNISYDGANYRYNATGAGTAIVTQNLGHVGIYTSPSGTAGTIATQTIGLAVFNSTGVAVGGASDPGAGNFAVTGTIAASGQAPSTLKPTKLIFITASGTYTPTSGVRSLYVECVGGGAGGGGAKAAASNAAAGSGGGGGGYASKYIASPAASYSVTIGGGGAGGLNTGVDGSVGTATTFGASLVNGNGGAIGKGDAVGHTAGFITSGGLGGAGGTGDFNTPGGDGGNGFVLSGTIGTGGNGGQAMFAGMSRGSIAAGAGQAGNNYGGGGAGGLSLSATGAAGGAGAAGCIRIWEFF